MKNSPKIIIKRDLNQEVDLFIKFLNHPYYPQHRFMIFKVFPELEILLKTTKNKNREKLIVKKFILDFHKKHKKIIKQIIKKSNILIEKKRDKALGALAGLMDYSWPQPIIYKAIPTILPFSPLGDNIFYFSILGQIKDSLSRSSLAKAKNKNIKDIICIAIHEISHFIFYDILKRIEQETKSLPTGDNLKNYLKESLTSVLLNQKPLCTILNLHNYLGNPEIHDIQIREPGGKILKFTDFLQEAYRNSRSKEKETFQIFLQEILNTLSPSSKDLSNKREIWNRFGKELSKNPRALKAYQRPIQLKLKKGKD